MRVFTICAAVAFAAAPLVAFDYDEHKYLSNIALRTAIRMAPCPLEIELNPYLEPRNIEAKRSFGDVAGLADYVRDVDVLFERQGRSDLVIDRSKGYQGLDWDHIAGLKSEPLRFLQAAHLNETHFQQAALLAHLDHHEAARALARNDNLHRALVMEAYALHFLEDFHAPGHIAATRSGMVDYVAIASHGKYNADGLNYRFRPDADRLLPIIDAMLKITASLQVLRHKDARFAISEDDLRELRAAIQERKAVTFYGDSLLRKHTMQAAYLAVLATRSVLDVLEAACHSDTATNNFTTICWVMGPGTYDAGTCNVAPEGLLRSAGIAFGEWDVAAHRFYRVRYAPWDVNLISFYTESQRATEADTVRGQIAVESLLWSHASPAAFAHRDTGGLVGTLRSVNTSIGYGYLRTFSDVSSSDLYVKAIAALPRIDLQFSVTAGRRHFDLGRRSRDRYPITYGIETGYGFLFAHLGYTVVPFINPLTGGLRHERAIRSGITFVLPTREGVESVARKLARLGR